VGAALDDAAGLEDDDLVDPVQAVGLVGDQQRRAPGGDVEQVGGEGAARVRVEAGGWLVEDEQRRVREQRPGQGDPLPFAARDGRAVHAHGGLEALGERLYPGQQPGPCRGVRQLFVARARPGEPEVVRDRRVEDVRVLRAAADHAAHVVGGVARQIVAAESGGAAGQVDEPHQEGGDRGLARAVRADEGDAPARAEVQVQAVEGERRARAVADPGGAQRDGDRRLRRRPRPLRLAHRIGGVEHGEDAAGGGPGVPDLQRGTGQRGDRLERGQRREGDHGQRHPAERARPGGRDPQDEHAPHGQAGGEGGEPGAEARGRGRPAGERGQLGVPGRHPVQGRVPGAERVQVRRAVQQVDRAGGQVAAGGAGPVP